MASYAGMPYFQNPPMQMGVTRQSNLNSADFHTRRRAAEAEAAEAAAADPATITNIARVCAAGGQWTPLLPAPDPLRVGYSARARARFIEVSEMPFSGYEHLQQVRFELEITFRGRTWPIKLDGGNVPRSRPVESAARRMALSVQFFELAERALPGHSDWSLTPSSGFDSRPRPYLMVTQGGRRHRLGGAIRGQRNSHVAGTDVPLTRELRRLETALLAVNHGAERR